MNKITKSMLLVAQISGWLVLILTLALIVIIRILNTAMTETQLFLHYLPVWILCIPTVIIGYQLANVRKV